jgi:phosphatidylglycerol:prolipoprotein diacylglycerol transferase
MHPVLLMIPGWAFKLVVPGLILWGLYSLLVTLAGRRRGEEGEGDEPSTEARPALRWLPADSPGNALVAMAIGVGLFVFASPVRVGEGTPAERLVLALLAFARGVGDPAVWRGAWQSLPIYSYGVMLGLSLVAGWRITLSLATRQGFPRERAADCYIFTAVMAVLGSRVLYVLTNLHEFRDPETHQIVWSAMLALGTGGLVAYGGFLGGLLGSALYLRRAGLSLWQWADAAVPSLASGLAITRIGCYLYGCDFGKPLGVGAPAVLVRLGSFPHWADNRGSPAWQQHVEHGFRTDLARCIERFHGDWRGGVCHLDPAAASSAPVHPTQLYESLTGLLIFLALGWLWRRRAFDGQIFLAFGVLYGLARSALEIIRDDHERGFFAGLSTSQIIGLTTAALAAALYLQRRRAAPRALPLPVLLLR